MTSDRRQPLSNPKVLKLIKLPASQLGRLRAAQHADYHVLAKASLATDPHDTAQHLLQQLDHLRLTRMGHQRLSRSRSSPLFLRQRLVVPEFGRCPIDNPDGISAGPSLVRLLDAAGLAIVAMPAIRGGWIAEILQHDSLSTLPPRLAELFHLFELLQRQSPPLIELGQLQIQRLKRDVTTPQVNRSTAKRRHVVERLEPFQFAQGVA